MVKIYCTIALRLVRFLAFCVTFSAAAVMFASHETPTLTPFYKIDFSDLPSFKYFAYTNLFVGVYSLLVVFLPQDSLLWRLVVAVDVVATMLLTSTSSAAFAVAYLGKKGNFHANWRPICCKVPFFCDHVIGAIASCFVGVTIYMLLLLFSIHVVLNPLLVPGA